MVYPDYAQSAGLAVSQESSMAGNQRFKGAVIILQMIGSMLVTTETSGQ